MGVGLESEWGVGLESEWGWVWRVSGGGVGECVGVGVGLESEWSLQGECLLCEYLWCLLD